MNELFMRPDGNEDYRKFILYSFVHRDIEIKMSMYHFANDMVGYNVIQDFFESKGREHHKVTLSNLWGVLHEITCQRVSKGTIECGCSMHCRIKL